MAAILIKKGISSFAAEQKAKLEARRKAEQEEKPVLTKHTMTISGGVGSSYIVKKDGKTIKTIKPSSSGITKPIITKPESITPSRTIPEPTKPTTQGVSQSFYSPFIKTSGLTSMSLATSRILETADKKTEFITEKSKLREEQIKGFVEKKSPEGSREAYARREIIESFTPSIVAAQYKEDIKSTITGESTKEHISFIKRVIKEPKEVYSDIKYTVGTPEFQGRVIGSAAVVGTTTATFAIAGAAFGPPGAVALGTVGFGIGTYKKYKSFKKKFDITRKIDDVFEGKKLQVGTKEKIDFFGKKTIKTVDKLDVTEIKVGSAKKDDWKKKVYKTVDKLEDVFEDKDWKKKDRDDDDDDDDDNGFDLKPKPKPEVRFDKYYKSDVRFKTEVRVERPRIKTEVRVERPGISKDFRFDNKNVFGFNSFKKNVRIDRVKVGGNKGFSQFKAYTPSGFAAVFGVKAKNGQKGASLSGLGVRGIVTPTKTKKSGKTGLKSLF